MNDRSQRLKELKKIPPFARLDHRHLLNQDGKPVWQENLSRNERRKLKAEGKKIGLSYNKIIGELYNSGVGFPVDQTTRNMAAEYTHRFASSGTNNLPVSFNYFEPFLDAKLIPNSYAPYMSLTPEINHLFTATDFFDFLTSIDSGEFEVSGLLQLPEGRTFHFTNNGLIEELTFFDASGREYVLSGFSMVRRGNSIHWFLVAGEKLSPDEWELRCQELPEIELQNISPWKRAFLRESIERAGSTTGAPMKLEGTDAAVRTLVAGEFDVALKKHIGRSIFIETEHSFAVFSDDPEILVAIRSSSERDQLVKNAMERIGEADVLWNMAEGLFQLPQYFETRVTVSKELVRGAGKPLGLKGKGGRGARAEYVAVEAVAAVDGQDHSVVRRVSLPQYSMETEGHWRRLKIDSMGNDRDGNPVKGKTWVRRSSPWRENSERGNVVYVKDCLATAKARVEQLYAESETQDSGVAPVEGNGELYVLRCSLMAEEVYKVGWTSGTATERARQLSSATGVPLAFVVVESWSHYDPEGLETEVHAQLAPYRVNNQREFFRLNFKGIRRVITETIERVSASEV